MRFKLDENLHPDGAAVLRRFGNDVLTIWDQQLQGASDSTVADVLRVERRILVTFDTGFADIRTYPPGEFAGLIVLRLRRQDRRSLIQALERIVEALANRSLDGQLWIVDERRIRMRGREG